MDDLRITINQHLKSIVDILFVIGSDVESNDVESGKMGIVILFSQYCRLTSNEIYSDFAYELIADILTNLSVKNTKYIHELCEVGIGIEYLLQERYFEAESNDILIDFDDILSKTLDDNFLFLSLDDIIDIGKYFSWRMNSKNIYVFKKYINRVIDLIEMHLMVSPICSYKIINLLYRFTNLYHHKSINQLLEMQLLLFNLSFVEKDPLRWSYSLSQVSNFSESFSIANKLTLNDINKRSKVYFDFKQDNFKNGNAGQLIWQLMIEDEPSIKCIKRLLLPKNTHSLFNVGDEKMGLLTGITGIGLTLLSLIDRKNLSWLNLL